MWEPLLFVQCSVGLPEIERVAARVVQCIKHSFCPGTENAAFVERKSPPRSGSKVNFPELLRAAGISVVFECTIYDASIDVIMTPLVASEDGSDTPPGFVVFFLVLTCCLSILTQLNPRIP